jgi:predicted MFS family arabinose efflux permease
MIVETRTPTTSRRVLLIVLGGQAMASMDGSIVNVALPSIRAQLAVGGAQIQLVTASYLVAFAAVVVAAARLGDRHGHARMFRFGLAGFTLASLACGLAPDAYTLIVARLIQGAAGAMLVAQVVSLIQLSFQAAARTTAIAFYSLVLALAVAAGQIVGGAIVSADLAGLGWRPIFLVNLPAGVVLLVMSGRLPAAETAVPIRRLDLAGATVLALSAAAVVGPLSIGRQQGWPLWSWAVLVAGVAGVVGFVSHEGRVIRDGGEPLLDLRALRPPGVLPGLIACFLVMGVYTVFLFTLTQYLQNGLDFTPWQAGLTFVPFAVGFATVSRAWTRLPGSVSRWLPVAGPIAFAAGITATAVLSADRWPTLAAVVLLAVAGAGHAASFSPLFARVAGLLEARFASALSALANTGTLLAGAVAVAGLGGVYLSSATAHSGLIHVVLAADALLAVTAAGAGWTVTRPS